MNQIVITGRLTNKPELRYTTTNKPVCEFTIASNRPAKQDGIKEADFIRCQVWNKTAENLCKYQDKGSFILVDGSYRVERYTNQNNQDVYKNFVLVNKIEFLQNKPSEVQNSQESDTNPFEEFGDTVVIDGDFLE